MKSKLIYAGVLTVLFSSYIIADYSQDTAKVSAYFIGSHGYLLKSSTKKVALDALIYWTGDIYGYIGPPEEIMKKMELSEKPFDSIDIIMVSHAHSEHYNTKIIEKVMLKNKNTVMLIPQEVYDILKNNVDSLNKYNDRIIVPHISFYHSFDTIIKGVPITITNLAHGPTREMNLFTYSFEMDSIRFLHLNQWNDLNSAMLDTLGFNKKRADVAFIGSDYITDNNKFPLFKKINPRFSEMSHIDNATSAKLNSIQNKINEYKQEYPMDLMTIPMEQLLFKKIHNTLIVDTLNNAPDLNFNLKDTSINIKVLYKYTIPENLFNDKDGDDLTYTVTLDNGSALPAWLTFDPQSRSLSGTPSAKGAYNIKITASDPDVAEVNDVFKLTVTDHTAIFNVDDTHLKDKIFYPNPTSGKLNIKMGRGLIPEAIFEIYDLQGKLAYSKTFHNTALTNLDISNLPKGIYMVKTITGRESFYVKICKE